MTDHDDPIDFSAFSEVPLDALVRDIDARCSPLLAARRAHAVTIQLGAWWRPAAAAAVAIAAASTLALLRAPTSRSAPAPAYVARRPLPSAPSQVAMALGVPRPLVGRLTVERPPTLSELLPEATQ